MNRETDKSRIWGPAWNLCRKDPNQYGMCVCVFTLPAPAKILELFVLK